MAVTLHEVWESRNPRYGANGGGETLVFVAVGSSDQVEVFDYVAATAALVFDGFIRQDIRLTPLGGNAYRVEVEYGTFGLGGGETPVGTTPAAPAAPGGNGGGLGGPGDDEALGPGYAFDITAETLHVTQAIKSFGGIIPGAAESSGIQLFASISGDNKVEPTTDGVTVMDPEDVGKTVWVSGGTGWTKGPYVITAADGVGNTWTLDRPAAAPGTANGFWRIMPMATNHKGAVGVTTDKVEGVDIFGPKFDWSRSVSRETVTRRYMRTLRNLVGKKNDAPFYGSEPGEVLYLGASGSYAQGGKWSITHKFSEIANKSNIVIIPGELTIPFKRGWDYMWFKYKKQQVVAGEAILNLPIAAYVEEVVEDGDMSLIEIGF